MQFKDQDGVAYDLRLTIGSFMKIKEAMDISLDQLLAGQPMLFIRFDDDAAFLGKILKVLIPSINLDRMDGVCVGKAREALWQELTSFFQSAGGAGRAMLRVIEKKDERHLKLIAALNEPSGKEQESSESTPAPTPTKN